MRSCDASYAALKMIAESNPSDRKVTKSGNGFVIVDSSGIETSETMTSAELRIARRLALTSIEANPDKVLSSNLQALIRYQVAV